MMASSLNDPQSVADGDIIIHAQSCLEELHMEISNIKCEVFEAVRAFYTQSSTFSIEKAIEFASSWMTSASSSGLGSGTAANNHSPIEEKLMKLESVLYDTVEKLQHPEENANSSADTNTLAQSITKYQRVSSQIENAQNVLSLLRHFTGLDSQFRTFDTAFDQEKFLVAGKSIQDMEVQMNQLLQIAKQQYSDSSESSIFQVMQHQVLKRQHQFQYRLKELFELIISEGDSGHELLVVKQEIHEIDGCLLSHKLTIHELWSVIEMSPTLLSETITEFYHNQLWNKVLQPLFQRSSSNNGHNHKMLQIQKTKHGKTLHWTLSSTREASHNSSMSNDDDDDDGHYDPNTSNAEDYENEGEFFNCLNQLYTIIEFVVQEICCNEANLIQIFGSMLWNVKESSSSLISHLFEALHYAIPEDPRTIMNSFEAKIKSKVEQFETNLNKLGFEKSEISFLSQKLLQFNRLYGEKKRKVALLAARDLIQSDYINSTKIVDSMERTCLNSSSTNTHHKGKQSKDGVTTAMTNGSTGEPESDDFFQLPSILVTTCTQRLVEMAHQHLIEMTSLSSSSSSASALINISFQTSRDLLNLFRAITPILYPEAIANDPRTCMLFHNDCLYISHHLIYICHLYRSKFASPLNQTATMVDMVPIFRETGEKALDQFVKKTKKELLLSLSSETPNWTQIHLEKNTKQLEGCTKSILYKLSQLSITWKSGFPSSIYPQIMGNLINPLIAQMFQQLITLPLISADAARSLQLLLFQWYAIEQLFDTPAQMGNYVPLFSKFKQIVDSIVRTTTFPE